MPDVRYGSGNAKLRARIRARLGDVCEECGSKPSECPTCGCVLEPLEIHHRDCMPRDWGGAEQGREFRRLLALDDAQLRAEIAVLCKLHHEDKHRRVQNG